METGCAEERVVRWGRIAAAAVGIITFIGLLWAFGYNYAIPASREVFARGSDPPPYASIERVNSLEVVELKSSLDMLIQQNIEAETREKEDTLMELRSNIRDERRRWCLALAENPPQPVAAYRANVEQDTDKFFSLTGQDFVIPPCSDFTR